jgi:glycosyltransferase involved in cell wall biosynthesis
VRITYVLPQPELSGGIKVVLQHAALLQRQGLRVTLLGAGPAPLWTRPEVPYHDYEAAVPQLPEQDLVIATYWTTVAVARRLALGPLAHFCQGYEGGMVHLAPVLADIEAVYALDLPTLVVAPHLGDFLRARFRRESVLAPPPLDPAFRPLRLAWRPGPRRRPWIAVPGIFEAEVKGVPTALAAVSRLRGQRIPCRVLRFSVLPLSAEEERLLPPDRYLHAVPPDEVATSLRRCDLLLLPSRAEEGFGLPLLEAMASKVPVVASRIPSTEHIGGAACLVPVGDAGAMAEAAGRLLRDPRAWRQARRHGFEKARRFRPEVLAPQLVEALRWARRRALAEGEPAGAQPWIST